MYICDLIKKNKYLSLDQKICCGGSGENEDCLNVNSRCYRNDRLVRCYKISGMDACERRHLDTCGEMNNSYAGTHYCNLKNHKKHICVSTNSTASGPGLDNELNWIVNRVNDLGDS